MSWTRRLGSVVALVLAGVVLFDLAAWFLVPELVWRIEPTYRWGPQQLAGYYRPSESRGFDIRPGARALFRIPDGELHPVWGNSLGCFDDEPTERVAPDVYLAGDSFTWGYVPHEARFGTIIERETGLSVLSCGIVHTGQRHQFDKFLEINQRLVGWPKLVIVNVYKNDLASDFAFPHTVATKHGLVEDTYLVWNEGRPILVRKSIKQPERKSRKLELKARVQQYSASLNIAKAGWRAIARTLAPETQPTGWRSLSSLYPNDSYPIWADFAAPHREVLREWTAHAAKHGYAIRFSLIPTRWRIDQDVFRELRAFLGEIGAAAWDFGAYVTSQELDPRELYWQNDIHFSTAGDAAYARFLLERIGADARSGTLPKRFADIREPSAVTEAR